MNQTGKVVTREALYEAVWSRTLKMLAREWNTTYARLVAACRSMDIPRPDPAYWSLVARGFVVDKQPLSEKQESTPDKFELLPPGLREQKKWAGPSPEPTPNAEPEEPVRRNATNPPGNEGDEQPPTAPAQQQQKPDLMRCAETAMLDMIRQNWQIDFWRESISKEIYFSNLAQWLELDDAVKVTKEQLLRAVKNIRKDFRTFYVSVKETTDHYNPASLKLSVEAHLRDCFEWKDAWEEAWSFSKTPNPHCLSDNALRLYQWARSVKNTGQMTDQNKIGKQACLRRTYHYIEKHLNEIQLKADPNLQFEKQCDGWRSQIRIYFKHVEQRCYHYGPLNPSIGLDVREAKHFELDRFTKWLYGEILKAEFPDGKETVGLFDIRDRKTVGNVFEKLPGNCGTYGPLPDFFRALRLIDGLDLRYSFKEGGGPWLVVCLPNERSNWKDIKDRLRAKAKEIPLAKRYKLSSDSLALLQWITDLREDEYMLKMTPTVEDRLSEEVGILMDVEEGNLRSYLELLVEEINENTDFKLRTIPWQHYNETRTRILVKKKKADLDDVVQAIQRIALGHNKILSDDQIRTVVNAMMVEKRDRNLDPREEE